MSPTEVRLLKTILSCDMPSATCMSRCQARLQPPTGSQKAQGIPHSWDSGRTLRIPSLLRALAALDCLDCILSSAMHCRHVGPLSAVLKIQNKSSHVAFPICLARPLLELEKLGRIHSRISLSIRFLISWSSFSLHWAFHSYVNTTTTSFPLH